MNIGNFNRGPVIEKADPEQKELDGLINHIDINDFGFTPEQESKFRKAINIGERGKRNLALALFFLKMSIAGATTVAEKAPVSAQEQDKFIPEHTYHVDKDGHDYSGSSKAFKVEGGGTGPLFGEGEPLTLNSSAYFETGKVVFRPGAMEMAEHDILVYFTRVQMENKGLDNTKIIVTGLSSKERPTKLNRTLAEQRLAAGLELVKKVIDKYFKGENIVIETVVASDASIYEDMSPEEIKEFESIADTDPEKFTKLYNEKVDAKQSIKIEAVTKTVGSPSFDNPEDYSNVSVIFGDRSGTMKDNMGAVESLAEQVNEMRESGDQIKIINIEGGNNEQHLQTVLHYLESEDGQNSTGDLFLITDEGVNQLPGEGGEAYVARYNREVGKIIKLLGGRKLVIKFLDPRPGSYRYKVFNLNDKPEGLLRQARPTGVTAESPKFTEEKLNLDLFEKIERYQDQGDKPEKEKVSDDKTFHPLKGN